MNYAISVRHPLHFSLFDFFICLCVFLLAVSGCVTGKSSQFLYFMIYFHLSAKLCLPRLIELREEQEFPSPLLLSPSLCRWWKTPRKLLVAWSLSGLMHTAGNSLLQCCLGYLPCVSCHVSTSYCPIKINETLPLHMVSNGLLLRAVILFSLSCQFLRSETSKKKKYRRVVDCLLSLKKWIK